MSGSNGETEAGLDNPHLPNVFPPGLGALSWPGYVAATENQVSLGKAAFAILFAATWEAGFSWEAP